MPDIFCILEHTPADSQPVVNRSAENPALQTHKNPHVLTQHSSLTVVLLRVITKMIKKQHVCLKEYYLGSVLVKSKIKTKKNGHSHTSSFIQERQGSEVINQEQLWIIGMITLTCCYARPKIYCRRV